MKTENYPSANKRPRLRFVDGAKGFALIAVMLGHTAGGCLVSYIDNFLLPLFWVAAGFTSRPDFSLRRKFRSLIVPYLLMSAVCLLFTAIQAPSSIGWRSLLGVIYSRFSILPFDDSGSHLVLMNLNNSVLWFLTSLFTAYCLFRVILSCGGVRSQALASVACVSCGFFYQFVPILLPWSIDTAFFIAPLMWCGSMLRRCRVFERYGWRVLLLSLPLYALCNAYAGPTNYSVRLMGDFYPASFGCALTGAVSLMTVFMYIERTYINKVFAFVNEKALYVFGLQLIFITAASYVCGHLHMSLWQTVACQIILAVVGGYAAGVVAERLPILLHGPLKKCKRLH